MAPRFRILLAVALSVWAADQWTKLLAVKHLTPGFAVAVSGAAPHTFDELDAQIEGIGFLEQWSVFFGAPSVVRPCEIPGARCAPIKVIDGFWDWRYVQNPGAAWSIFSNLGESIRVPFLVAIPIIAVLCIGAYIRKLGEDQRLTIVALSLLAGGALGNATDRGRLGYVIDFIDWYAGTTHWPTFNVADIAISTGLGLLGLASLLEYLGKRTLGGAEAVR